MTYPSQIPPSLKVAKSHLIAARGAVHVCANQIRVSRLRYLSDTEAVLAAAENLVEACQHLHEAQESYNRLMRMTLRRQSQRDGN